MNLIFNYIIPSSEHFCLIHELQMLSYLLFFEFKPVAVLKHRV